MGRDDSDHRRRLSIISELVSTNTIHTSLYYSSLVIILSAIGLFLLILTEVSIIALDSSKRSFLLSKEKDINEKLQSFSSADVLRMKQSKEKQFVLIDNILVDVGSYLDNHPGGRNLLEESLYGDVTRFMNGSVPFSSSFKAVDHKCLSCLFAIKFMSFGKIQENHNIVVDSNDKSYYLFDTMSIQDSRVTTGVTKEFRLRTKENLKELRFARYLPGFSWMGRHFSITSKKMNINRLYSLCLAGNEKIHNLHLALLDNVTSLQNGVKPIIKHLSKEEYYDKNLEIYVKRYDFPNAFSNYLHKGSIEQDDLTVKGPLGLGLCLPDSELDGTYIAFSAGTGVYCFLDFVAVVIRKLIHKISVQLNCENNTLIENENFMLSENFQLHLFCAYPDEKNAFWHDIFTKAAGLDDKYNIGLFKYYPRLSSQSSKRWDSEFYREKLKSVNSNLLKRVFLCGPSHFIDSVKDHLINDKIADKEIITLV